MLQSPCMILDDVLFRIILPRCYDKNIKWYAIILTHGGQVTHICVSKLTIIGSDNGLSPGRHQAINWTNAGMLLIGPLCINFSEILIEVYIFSFKKMRLKMSSGKWQPFYLGLHDLTHWDRMMPVCVSEHSQHWKFPSPVCIQATTGTVDDVLSLGPSQTHFSEFWIKVRRFTFEKMLLKMSTV